MLLVKFQIMLKVIKYNLSFWMTMTLVILNNSIVFSMPYSPIAVYRVVPHDDEQ